MPYQIEYTDSINKGSIIVEDATLNTETSITLPGRNVTSYGQAVSENFLHLLENFASASAPARPVEGQLWYDTSDGVNQLKLYDGTTWTASGGLKKSSTQPEVSNSIAGDVWVNIESQQLYLFTGAGWVLVGPQFSDGLLTGATSEEIIGDDDVTYTVLILKIKEQPVIILSDQSFVPKITLVGFRTGIKAGMNITSQLLVGEELKYYGLSEKAESLVVAGRKVPASNFLRADIASQTNFDLSIKNNEGLQIGSGSQLKLSIENEAAVVSQSIAGSNIDFRLKTSTAFPTIMRLDSAGFVGVNNLGPEAELDVKGDLKIRPRDGSPQTGTIIVENNIPSTDISSGSIVTTGGVGIGLDLNVGGNTTIVGSATVADIVPDGSGTRNIGTPSLKFDQVYSNNFVGNLQGNVNGTVTGRAGSADRLVSATTFALTGDVEPSSIDFDGQTGGTLKQLNVEISNSFISRKDTIYDADNQDELLLNKRTGSTGVYKISKRNLLKTIPLVPAGSIMPYGGTEAPTGWLLCDGAEVLKSDYTELFNSIGFNFKDASLLSDQGVNSFALPDLRGRFAMGADNMGGISADRVTDIAADSIGGNAGAEERFISTENLPDHEHDMEAPSGTQYYGLRVGSGEPVDEEAITFTIDPGTGGTQAYPASGGIKSDNVGQQFNIMNPYLSINYIIYTGQ